MMGVIGGFIAIAGFFGLFTGEFLTGLFMILIGGFMYWCEVSTAEDNRKRHENDYGKVARCYKCNSTRVYAMTWDDKRDSVNFWGAASTKIGKRYHCDNCGNEW